jgi:molecular chaperone DnaK
VSYWLGIDVGTTFTAAAICREGAGGCRVPEVVALGAHSAAVSSVVYLAPDGQVVVGQAAEQRAQTHPQRVVREFKRRVGDEVPMVIGGVAHTAAEVAAMVVSWVAEQVTQREGKPAAGIVLTHPASWGSYKIQTMAEALQAAGLPPVRFRTEPEAAALSYALAEPIAAGSTIAVYDLGGGTCDVAIVRKTGAGGFAVLGHPRGIDHLGGADFDDAVFSHVLAAVPALRELDDPDPATLAAIAALRRECIDAKEALSADTEVAIPVHIGQARTQVRLVRAEFDDLIRPQLTQTLHALHQALQSAKLDSHDLDAVLLVGGSSRIPLVAQLVSAELGRPLAINADPQAAIALGAALSALPTTSTPVALPTTGTPATSQPIQCDVPPGPRTPPAGLPVPAPPQQPPRPSFTAIPLDIEPARRQWRRARTRRVTKVVLAGVLALCTAAGVAAVPFLTSHSGSLPPVDAGAPAPGAPAPNSAVNAPAGNAPAVNAPVVNGPLANAGSGNDGAPSGRSGGVVRTTAPAAPTRPAGGTSRAGPPAPQPPPTWVTTYTWTSTWSSPPTHSPSPEPTTTPATTSPSASPPPPTATTVPPHASSSPQSPPT